MWPRRQRRTEASWMFGLRCMHSHPLLLVTHYIYLLCLEKKGLRKQIWILYVCRYDMSHLIFVACCLIPFCSRNMHTSAYPQPPFMCCWKISLPFHRKQAARIFCAKAKWRAISYHICHMSVAGTRWCQFVAVCISFRVYIHIIYYILYYTMNAGADEFF